MQEGEPANDCGIHPHGRDVANDPSETHARQLEKLVDKLMRIQSIGQAMEAVMGMTSCASKTLRRGGKMKFQIFQYVNKTQYLY